MPETSLQTSDPSDEHELWDAVLARDASKIADFVYAVDTTGVFCRPSCPSRRPNRENVRFFSTPEQARLAGFRPCKRCGSGLPADRLDAQTYAIRAACRFIASQRGRVLGLREVAEHVGWSEGHLHRVFKRRLGLTPRAFAAALREGNLRRRLRAGDSVTRALYAAGYSSPSRLYETSTAQLGMTPGAFKRGARGIAIRYGIARCRLGRLVVAMTDQGVCFVALGDAVQVLETSLRDEFPNATLSRDDGSVQPALQPLIAFLEQGAPLPDLPLDVQATAFQRRVWDCLRRLPRGATISYSELARVVDHPGAARAVARACASNPTALVVPCHRVVRSDGGPGGYRWGASRKAELLALENGEDMES